MNIYEQNYVIHTFLLIYQPKAKVLTHLTHKAYKIEVNYDYG